MKVFNRTDGVFASPDEFQDLGAAEKFMRVYREKFRRLQGYYLTSSGLRIDPDDIELEVME